MGPEKQSPDLSAKKPVFERQNNKNPENSRISAEMQLQFTGYTDSMCIVQSVYSYIIYLNVSLRDA